MNKKVNPYYVNFEIAKLLKDKGFDVECNSCYHSFLKVGEEEIESTKSTPLLREFTQRKFKNSIVTKDNNNLFIN